MSIELDAYETEHLMNHLLKLNGESQTIFPTGDWVMQILYKFNEGLKKDQLRKMYDELDNLQYDIARLNQALEK